MKKRAAFSLVELSIVLVILGLLTGGILAGQSLIHAAELRSITTDYNKYATATRAFRDKYFALPGDMVNATAFWGSLGGTGADATCQAIDATGGTATCNGDNDGSLLWGGNTTNRYEWFRFWQHLANAGLIEGSYTGTGTAGYAPGINLPASKVTGTVFLPRNGLAYTAAGVSTMYTGSTNAFAGDYGKSVLSYTGLNPSSATAGSWALKPEDAWNLDTKLDDGMPGTGKVMSNKGDGTNTFCSSTAGGAVASDAGATYKFTNTAKDCGLYFIGLLP